MTSTSPISGECQKSSGKCLMLLLTLMLITLSGLCRQAMWCVGQGFESMRLSVRPETLRDWCSTLPDEAQFEGNVCCHRPRQTLSCLGLAVRLGMAGARSSDRSAASTKGVTGCMDGCVPRLGAGWGWACVVSGGTQRGTSKSTQKKGEKGLKQNPNWNFGLQVRFLFHICIHFVF